MNPQPHAHGDDARTVEADLQALSRRIDRVLRRRYATLGMVRLLSPPRFMHERGPRVAMHAPTRWLLIVSALLVLASAVTTGFPQWLPSAWTLPALAPSSAAVAVLALLLFERLLYPRIALARYRFRLMRLERNDGNAEFPFVYTVARAPDSASGFGWEAWKGAQNVAPGDLVISIADAHGRGRGLILLRTVGRLPALVWDRDLLQHDAFPALPADVRALAHDFDRACDRHAAHADRIERGLIDGNLRIGQLLLQIRMFLSRFRQSSCGVLGSC